MPQTDRRIDTYIEKSAPFAQPVLTHLRELMHKGVPEIEETIKWKMPFFTLNGIILCNMAAFKSHCAFGFWGEELVAKLKAKGVASGERAMGVLRNITSLADLPKDKDLIAYLREGAAAITSGERTVSYKRPARKVAKAELKTPAELTAALKKNKTAAKVFADFPPGKRREYIEWIAEAKRDETRAGRVSQAVKWIAEGKSRNWKYERR